MPLPRRILPVVAAFAILNPVPALTTPEVMFVSPTPRPVEKYPPPVTDNVACVGDVLPIPTFPPLVAKYAEPVDPMFVVEACVKVARPVTLSVEVATTAPPKNPVPLA